MTSGTGEVGVRNARLKALAKLANTGVSPFRLGEHKVLLTLVAEVHATSETSDQSRADALFRAFNDVAVAARTSALTFKEPLSNKNEAAQIAAAAELLGLGDEVQFLAIFMEKPSALVDVRRLAHGESQLVVRKLRAASWVGNSKH
jgi:hypothetical protein